MNVKLITEEYLQTHGYDGLWNQDGECACRLNQLMPCDGEGGVDRCQPGYTVPCPEDCDCGGWHIGSAPARATDTYQADVCTA